MPILTSDEDEPLPQAVNTKVTANSKSKSLNFFTAHFPPFIRFFFVFIIPLSYYALPYPSMESIPFLNHFAVNVSA